MICPAYLRRLRRGEGLALGEDVQQLRDEQTAASGMGGDDIAVAEHATLLENSGLLQVLVRRDCQQNTRREKKQEARLLM